MNYSIGAFSQKTGFSIDTLRYYEKEGLIIPGRDANNRRVFDERDIHWVDFIRKLKTTGMKIKDIKYYAQLRYQGDHTVEERLNLLFKQSDILLNKQKEVQEHIDFLNHKIEIYQQMLQKQK